MMLCHSVCTTEGVPCQRRFPNGKVNEKAYIRRDSDGIRSFLRYRCNDGYRPHHAVRYVECVAGTLVTWNERFGIDVSKICIPVE